ncbi:MAG: AAA family ATPase [Promethearchaeota archaeon]
MQKTKINPIRSLISDGFLIILCGLPSSGKSLFVQSLKNKVPFRNFIEVVDTDKIRKNNFGNVFTPENEVKVRKMAIKEIENFLGMKRVVISDDINYYESMRQELKKTAEKMEKCYFIIYVSTPLENCLKWNKNRVNPIDESIIKKISEKFDIPGNRYQWDRPLLTVDLSEEDINAAIFRFENEIKEVIKKEHGLYGKESKKVSNTNKINIDIDIITRKFLNVYYEFVKDEFLEKKRINVEEADPIKNKIVYLIKNNAEIEKKFNIILKKFGKSVESLELLSKIRRNFMKSHKRSSSDKSMLYSVIIEFLRILVNK